MTATIEPMRDAEVVSIHDAWHESDGLTIWTPTHRRMTIAATTFVDRDGEVPYAEVVITLNVAGVEALRTACNRWLAAQEGTDGNE